MVDIYILVQCILYFCIFVAGFVVAVPIGVNKGNFNDQCVLYGPVKWHGDHFTMQGSSASNCNFPIYYGVFGMIFYGLAQGTLYAFKTHKSGRNPLTGYEMFVLIPICLNGAHVLVSLIVSCMISVGYLQFCDGITEHDLVTSCGQFANTEWRREDGEKFNAGPYTALLSTAEVASWIGFLLFIIQTALCILRFVRNRRKDRKGTTEVFSTGTFSDKKRIGELTPTA